MTKIVVTGASGRLGREVTRDLLDHGYEVRAVDAIVADVDPRVRVLQTELSDYGQTIDALAGFDAVVHLANIPAPEIKPAAVTFALNTVANVNVMLAAAQVGMTRVVWASSETTLGLPFDVPPDYAPVDEAHYPHPQSTYSLSKVVSETAADEITKWSGIPMLALRYSNILGPTDYQTAFPGYWGDAMLRKWNLWGYIDVRDAASATRLALDAPVTGTDSFVIAAADTVMTRPSADLLAEVFPDVPVRGEVTGHQTLLAIDHAREVLGWVPEHRWRDHVAEDGSPIG